MESIEQQYTNLARKLGFNPTYLKEIIRLRNLGYNNSQIAETTGISRVTVNRCVDKINQQQAVPDMAKLLILGLGLYVGISIFKEIFGGEER